MDNHGAINSDDFIINTEIVILDSEDEDLNEDLNDDLNDDLNEDLNDDLNEDLNDDLNEDLNEDEDQSRGDDNKDLEKEVFGGEDDMEGEFDEFIISRKRRTDEIECIKKKPKWHDDDDEDKEQKILAPAWAQNKVEEKDDSSDDEDTINWRTGDYITKSKFISSGHLNYLKCADINQECVTKGKVRVMEFLSKAAVAVVAGADQSLTLFQVDGKTNLKVQTILLESLPVFRAHFNSDGSEILIGSIYPSILSYNMNTGKTTKYHLQGNDLIKNTKLFAVSRDNKYIVVVGSFGHIHVLSAKSKKCLQLMKADSENVEALAFSPDGSELYTHGDNGKVHVWCMKTFKCTFSFQDDGCTLGTAIAASPDGKYIATGSSTGIVNLYDKAMLLASRTSAARYQLPQPKPLKAVENLVSACTSLAFNHTSELLAMASNYADNALKMLHIRSLTIYANFPSVTKSVGVPYSIGFSPNSGYFAVGNHNGHTHLYRLQHYPSY